MDYNIFDKANAALYNISYDAYKETVNHFNSLENKNTFQYIKPDQQFHCPLFVDHKTLQSSTNCIIAPEYYDIQKQKKLVNDPLQGNTQVIFPYAEKPSSSQAS
jgi:hypothetical protein